MTDQNQASSTEAPAGAVAGGTPAEVIPPAAVEAGAALYPGGGDQVKGEGQASMAAGTSTAAEGTVSTEGSVAAEGEVKPDAPLTLESYEIKLPDTIQIDDTLLKTFKELSLEGKVPPEVAQKYADLYANALQGQMKTLQDGWQAKQADWLKEIDTNPEFQGERRTQSLAILGRAMQEYGSAEAAAILNESGVGNHPAVVKYILGLAKGLVEGGPMPAEKPAPTSRDGRPMNSAEKASTLLYPKMNEAR